MILPGGEPTQLQRHIYEWLRAQLRFANPARTMAEIEDACPGIALAAIQDSVNDLTQTGVLRRTERMGDRLLEWEVSPAARVTAALEAPSPMKLMA